MCQLKGHVPLTHNEEFYLNSHRLSSPWLMKILNFNTLKQVKIKDSSRVIFTQSSFTIAEYEFRKILYPPPPKKKLKFFRSPKVFKKISVSYHPPEILSPLPLMKNGILFQL